ncbi:arginyltransferase [Natronospira sp.]|uniref:arginyltransferase n=1 Tax=Natronospira sp. TaxID=2024970 RepID=UPI0038733694
MTRARHPRLLLTGEQDCPYLPDRLSRNLVVAPESVRDAHDHSAYSRIGFRRSGDFLYRPHCGQCRACVPIRVLSRAFQPRRRHRRCLDANEDLQVEILPATFDEEAYHLYQAYQSARHPGGPMAEGDEHDYMGFIRSAWAETSMVHFRLDDRLVAVAVVDWLDDGLSAVYSFFDTALKKRSLGTYTILWQITETARRGLPHVYLGYWIQESPKMAYKTDFRPAELLIGGHWQRLEH